MGFVLGKVLGWIGGNAYVVGALVLALLGLGGYGLYQYARAEHANAGLVRAEARAADLAKQRDEALGSLKQAEADKAALVASIAKLDGLLANQKARLVALQTQKQKLQEAYDEIAKTVPQEDQDCLRRGLPAPIVERLRDRPDHPDEVPKATSP